MELRNTTTVDDVGAVVVSTLGLSPDARALDATTPLLGALPELDSMAVVELVAALEERFHLQFEDDEITGEVFETLGSLAAFVDSKQG